MIKRWRNRLGSTVGVGDTQHDPATPGFVAASPSDIGEQERHSSALHRAFYENDGPLVHKWRHYLSIYDRHLSAFCNTPVRFLEIGVSDGGSLRMWRQYFGSKAVIFGIDIDPRCAFLDGQDGSVRIGSQDDAAFLQSVVAEMAGIDIVIDDGSHFPEHQWASFQTLFPLLNETGVYICEDLHTAYWPAFGGGCRVPATFIERTKMIIDDIHADFHDHPSTVPDANRLINGLFFYNSMVVIEKKPQLRPCHITVGNFTLTLKRGG
jgi:hypothetical protein